MIRSSQHGLYSERGSATLEFAFSSILFIFLAFATVEYGMIYSERMAVTSLAREGASLASRQLATNGNILAMLTSTQGTLGLKDNPGKYSIFLAQVNGATANGNDPVCAVAATGTLTHSDIAAPAPGAQCDLPDNLYNLLQWNTDINAPGINQFTVLKVYYQHTPLTPIGGISPVLGGSGSLNSAPLLMSRAIF